MSEAAHQNAAVEYRTALIALLIGVGLLAMKFIAYFVTGSAAIFSDALESIANVAAGAFALYSVYLAARPADEEHPYGHGKIEFLSAGFEGGLVLAAAVVMSLKAIDALFFHPVQIEHLGLGAVFMGVAMLVNGILGWELIHRGRLTKSLTLVADGKHLLTDAATSVVALLALGVVHWTGKSAADPIMALLIAIFVARVGVSLLVDSVHGLMDYQDVGDEAVLNTILDGHLWPSGNEPRICSYHKVRHRHSGRYHWVDFHIMLPAYWNIRQGHDVASAIEYEIEQALGEGKATAHIEPCADANCAHCAAQPHLEARDVHPRL
jgi:cation diffusion facilitator family transporter